MRQFNASGDFDSRLENRTGGATRMISLERKYGRIMAKWAYLGVIVGLIGTYRYMGVLKNDKTKLLTGSLFTLGGLALGSYFGGLEVQKLKEKRRVNRNMIFNREIIGHLQDE